MPRGDKSSYTSKQKRKAEHIEESYEKRGTSAKEAARRAWATVNKESGGGKKGGAASARRSASARSASAKRAAATRKSRGH
ncbi:MAG TPA: hypothetical protein VFE58_03165 [Tepidisphaeraceae bacterium]|nr:hypothetical protein [Tepidisphaeraceae bacterium]